MKKYIRKIADTCMKYRQSFINYFNKYEIVYDTFLVFVAVAATLSILDPSLNLIGLSSFLYSLIVFDFGLRFFISDHIGHPKDFIKENKIHLIALIPGLQIAFLIHMFIIIRRSWKTVRNLPILQLSSNIGIFLLLVLLLTAVMMPMVEPETFKNTFEGFYWGVTTVTSVGYGDITPVSSLGRFVAMYLMITGTVIFGVITAMVFDQLSNLRDERRKELVVGIKDIEKYIMKHDEMTPKQMEKLKKKVEKLKKID